MRPRPNIQITPNAQQHYQQQPQNAYAQQQQQQQQRLGQHESSVSLVDAELPTVNAAGRQALMQRLQERADRTVSPHAKCVALRNMFDGHAPDYDEAGIARDVRQEASRFGRVLRLVVERHSGAVFLQFDNPTSARNCRCAPFARRAMHV